MISPLTPPGTKIVCINNTPWPGYDPNMDGLAVGAVYTLAYIEETEGVLGAVLEEITRSNFDGVNSFDISRFKPAVLPSCLTDCLTAAPIRTRKTVGAS